MDQIAAYAIAVSLCLWQSNIRRRAGLIVYSIAMVVTGVGAATLELEGRYLAAISAGLAYVGLFTKSQLVMERTA